MAAVFTAGLETITVGLQGCDSCDEALQFAQSQAAERGERVLLEDDDGKWWVYPDGTAEEADESDLK